MDVTRRFATDHPGVRVTFVGQWRRAQCFPASLRKANLRLANERREPETAGPLVHRAVLTRAGAQNETIGYKHSPAMCHIEGWWETCSSTSYLGRVSDAIWTTKGAAIEANLFMAGTVGMGYDGTDFHRAGKLGATGGSAWQRGPGSGSALIAKRKAVV